MKVINRKARFNYEILEKFEAGIVLTGPEVKSVKEGRIKLDQAFVKIIDGQVWLLNANIAPYRFADSRDYEPARSRKLLLHKGQILAIQKKMEGRNLTIVPLSCYSYKGLVKLELGLGRGKKKWEKKEKIKRQDIEREMERDLKDFGH